MEKLPNEINTNILSRLPLRSIGQSKCVSKHWRTILSGSDLYYFRLTHSSNIIEPDLLFFVEDDSGYAFYYVESTTTTNQGSNDNNGGIPITYKTLSQLTPSFIGDLSPTLSPIILGSCNGFLCFSKHCPLNPISSHHPIYIVNPLTRQHSPLPSFLPPSRKNTRTTNWLSGFGYDESTKKFKLIIALFMIITHADRPVTFKNEVQLLTVGTNVWRRKVGIAPKLLYLSKAAEVSSVFVNGCLHWLTIDGTSSTRRLVIVSFNLGIEEFAFLSTPDFDMLHMLHIHDIYLYHTLVKLEQHLALMENRCQFNTQIWVMKEYNSKESWVKQYCISHRLDKVFYDRGVEILKVCKNGELLLVFRTHRGNCKAYYNATTHKCRFIAVEGLPKKYKRLQVLPFVGTLISLESAFGMDKDSA